MHLIHGHGCPPAHQGGDVLLVLAHAHSFVIGVDTHARTHTLAVSACFPTSQCYYVLVVNNAE